MNFLVCLTKQKALALVNAIKETIYKLPEKYKTRLYSVVLFGSLVRGDFIDDVSDVDILIVFRNGTSNSEIEYIIDKIKNIPGNIPGEGCYEAIDLVWLYEKELPLVNQPVKSPFKFLSIYAFDFIKNSKILYGVDFRDAMVVENPRKWIIPRVNRLRNLLKKSLNERNDKMLTILAGETIRLAQLVFGKPTINKKDVFRNFEKYVPDYPVKSFAAEIWGEYMSPKPNKKLSRKYIARLIIFVEKTLRMIENVK